MRTLVIIIARAGSKGLPGKNTAPLAGRPVVSYTLDHARSAKRIDQIVVSTDDDNVRRIATERGIQVIDRPPELANDTATVAEAVRHAVVTVERISQETFDTVVVLYANVPVRPPDLIDRAIEMLAATGCDSVQSLAPVGKHHPFWMKRLGGDANDRIESYVESPIDRRQNLPPLYELSGAIIALRRSLLDAHAADSPHAFLGSDQRGLVHAPDEAVDIDTPTDLTVAKSILASRSTPSAMAIAGRPVGPGHPVYIIAEIGVNHDGSVARAVELVDAARDAGADAVKMQLFDARRLLSRDARLAEYQADCDASAFDLLDRLALTTEEMDRVAAHARAIGVGFVVTCFSRADFDELGAVRADAIKIASPDAVNTRLIRAAQDTSLPLIVSTGASELAELEPLFDLCGERRPALLHCVSSYPTPTDQANLRRIPLLARAFGVPVGYSDHTEDIAAGALAVAHGATIIERHLTYDRAAPGPDHAASLDPPQFADYVKHIRSSEAMRAAEPNSVQPCEADVRLVSRQSVCTTIDLAAGHVITASDVTVKRPGTGIPAGQIDQVIGRTTARPIEADRVLHRDDIADGFPHS